MRVDQAAAVLADSFLDYPVMTALAGPTDRQRAVLPYFFRCCTRHALRCGGTVDEDGGAALWLDTQMGPTTLQALRCGLAALPLRVGVDRVQRATRHEEEAMRLLRRHVTGRYGCLWFVGVRRGEQGRGTARRLVDRALRAMASRGLGQAVLTTELEKNVTIWGRCGFQVRGQVHVEATGLPVWLMTRALETP